MPIVAQPSNSWLGQRAGEFVDPPSLMVGYRNAISRARRFRYGPRSYGRFPAPVRASVSALAIMRRSRQTTPSVSC